MIITIVPWVLAVVTACCFGLLAVEAGRIWELWAIAGGVFALVTSTFIFGLCQAVAIPFSDHELMILHLKWTLVCGVVVGALGWLLTLGLHRQHLVLWKKFTADSALTSTTPTSPQATPVSQTTKPSPAKPDAARPASPTAKPDATK